MWVYGITMNDFQNFYNFCITLYTMLYENVYDKQSNKFRYQFGRHKFYLNYWKLTMITYKTNIIALKIWHNPFLIQ